MFEFLRKRKIERYLGEANAYINAHFEPEPAKEKFQLRFSIKSCTKPDAAADPKQPSVPEQRIRSSISDKTPAAALEEKAQNPNTQGTLSDIHFSENYPKPKEKKPGEKNAIYSGLQETNKSTDPYNASDVTRVMHKISNNNQLINVIEGLERNINQTFVDRLIHYINAKGLRDSAVYKAAQVDKRLFSKIVSDREYKPSKDTAIALAFGLTLTLEEANDLLSRAGYTFSHSNKRDIIIEYFFRERVHNLIDINEVLYRLDQKVIGRF